MSLRDWQARLIALGFDPGPLDGAWGPLTEGASFAASQSAPEFDANTLLLIKELERDEGRVLHAYADSLGYLTIGIGRLIDKAKGGGISNAEADYLKANDIRRIQATLDSNYPWWRRLSPTRQRAFQNMAFQLGTSWPEKFPTSSGLIRDGHFAQAARNLRRSLWAKQTPARAGRVIDQIEKGD